MSRETYLFPVVLTVGLLANVLGRFSPEMLVRLSSVEERNYLCLNLSLNSSEYSGKYELQLAITAFHYSLLLMAVSVKRYVLITK